MSKIADSIRSQLVEQKNKESDFLRDVLETHSKLKEALGFSDYEIDALEQRYTYGDLCDVLGYSIYLKNTCIHPYGSFDESGGWRKLLMINGPQSIGGGTTHMTKVDADTVDQICEYIRTH